MPVSKNAGSQPIDAADIICRLNVTWGDQTMETWSTEWAIRPNGRIGCVACASEQASSRNGMPFIHEQRCRLKVDRVQRPWVLLKSLMIAMPAEGPQQWPPF
jgi:hypothetical protein